MRNHDDWIEAYCDYASFTEAPRHIHFWVAISTIAGILGRKVWIDQSSFKWYPNHYIFFVGPPDVISKSTTVKMGMSLLKRVPGFVLGPTSCSWQALVKAMADRWEMDYDLGDRQITQLCSITVSSTELGNFLKVREPEFLDMMISLWDGDTIDKELIKEGGSVYIENPLLNLNGCTTPSWISSNIPEHMLEGGLLSRVVFVFGDHIDHPVPYPKDNTPPTIKEDEAKLVGDLAAMDRLKGGMELSKSAKVLGAEWYSEMKMGLNGDEVARHRVTRKQTHVHKLAMILSVSRGDSLIISRDDLEGAIRQVDLLEGYREIVVRAVGRTLESSLSEKLIDFIKEKKACKMADAYRVVHGQVPSGAAFQDLIIGLVKAGYVKEQCLGGEITLVSVRGRS